MSPRFDEPGSNRRELENGTAFTPHFDGGLIVCVVADATDGEVLMLAYMNDEALARTIDSGEAWFFSRSRNELWRKGATSGNRFQVVNLRVDCDQDALLMTVKVAGNGIACHTGRRSCFYRAVPVGKKGAVKLEFHQ
ncbi:MAG: phosphoribosyl-AMP cyclohydrolase [Rhizobiales bacterium]|nr:phosphoribosyl-AMP cyclohydrolase [Hyphomicrobiales bacterium]